MDRIEPFQRINADGCNYFSVFRSATFDSRFHTKCRRSSMCRDELMLEVAQKFEKLVYGESQAIPKHENRLLCSISFSYKSNMLV